MAITFTYPALIQVVGDSTWTLSDHNRSPLAEQYEVIENARRTARGNRRKYHIAQRANFSVTWTKLPESDVNTVDGNAGAISLASMFESETDEVTLTINMRDGTTRTYPVHIIDLSVDTVHRYSDDSYYDMSISFEQTSNSASTWSTP